MERVAPTLGETPVRPGVVCVSELRVVYRPAEGILAEILDPRKRSMFLNAIFLVPNDSAL